MLLPAGTELRRSRRSCGHCGYHQPPPPANRPQRTFTQSAALGVPERRHACDLPPALATEIGRWLSGTLKIS
ncbi:unnamed protein product [Colias eurytheme]|nr:unnamed protein product [Colias eurytheme]